MESRLVLVILICGFLINVLSLQTPTVTIIQKFMNGNNHEILKPKNGEITLTDRDFRDYYITFECKSEQPIEWTYVGPNYPNQFKFSEKSDRLDVSGLPIVHLRRLTFFSAISKSTGTYACKNVNDDSLVTSVYAVFESYIILFIPDKRALINFDPIEDRPHHLLHTFVTIEDEQKGRVLIPLHSNLPKDQNLKVYLKGVNGKYEDVNNFEYNRRQGLTLQLTEKYQSTVYKIVYGKDANNQELKVLATLLKQYRVDPKENHLDNSDSTQIKFTCEANYELEMSFSGTPVNGDDAQPKKTENQNKEAEYKYKIEWKLTPENYSYRTKLECYTILYPSLPKPYQNFIIHNWYFTTMKPTEVEMSYDPDTKIHTCCTDSYYKPAQYNLNCDSFTRCEFLQQEQKYTDDYIVIPELKYNNAKACVNSKFFKESTVMSYMVTCMAGPDVYNFDLFSMYEDGKELKLSKATVHQKLRICPIRRCREEEYVVELGDIVSIWCEAERFAFGSPSMFIEYKNGTFAGQSTTQEVSSNYNIAAITVKFDTTDIVGIRCGAGQLYTDKLTTTTLKLLVENLPTTTDDSMISDATRVYVKHNAALLVIIALECLY